jgi:hypothetical protein
MKGKLIKASYSWGGSRKNPVLAYELDVLRYPSPNWHNVGEELFRKGAFASGLTVGYSTQPKGGGLVVHPTYGNVIKTLNKRGVLHANTSKCLMYYDGGTLIQSRLKSLPPDKQDNELLAQQVVLKMNIAAGDYQLFQPGFGDLVYDNHSADPSDPFNFQTIRTIASRVDSFLGCILPQNGISGTAYLNAIRNINGAFAGPPDTVSFASDLKFTGVRSLGEIRYLYAVPGMSPTIVTPGPPVAEYVPTGFELYQNYPNPFNPSTTIAFDLAQPSRVTIKAYNMIGQQIATIVDGEELDDGYQEVEFDASGLPSGTYFYRLEASIVGDDEEGISPGNVVKTGKMLLIK